jgi:predicted transcriptional regulator
VARQRSPTLTDGETRLMAVLWDQGRATVAEVLASLGHQPRVTYSTVQTLLRILETKGYVAHEKVGRAFVYRPVVDQHQARRRAVRHLLSRLFDNSPSQLLVNVLENERIEPSELRRLKKLIEEA